MAGSTVGLIDPTGAVRDSYSYDPYGARTVVTGSAAGTPFGDAGQYTDAETGFQYLLARSYDPAHARWPLRRTPRAMVRAGLPDTRA